MDILAPFSVPAVYFPLFLFGCCPLSSILLRHNERFDMTDYSPSSSSYQTLPAPFNTPCLNSFLQKWEHQFLVIFCGANLLMGIFSSFKLAFIGRGGLNLAVIPCFTYILIQNLVNLSVLGTTWWGPVWFLWRLALYFLKLFTHLVTTQLKNSISSTSLWAWVKSFLSILFLLACNVALAWGCWDMMRGVSDSTMLFVGFDCAIIFLDLAHATETGCILFFEEYAEMFPQIMAYFGLSIAEIKENRIIVIEGINSVHRTIRHIMVILHNLHAAILNKKWNITLPIIILNLTRVMSILLQDLLEMLRAYQSLKTVQSLFLDASPSDIQHNNDNCAICREPMHKAKKLLCGHLFHVECLRLWVKEGTPGSRTCPQCRAPFPDFSRRENGDWGAYPSPDLTLAPSLTTALNSASSSVQASVPAVNGVPLSGPVPPQTPAPHMARLCNVFRRGSIRDAPNLAVEDAPAWNFNTLPMGTPASDDIRIGSMWQRGNLRRRNRSARMLSDGLRRGQGTRRYWNAEDVAGPSSQGENGDVLVSQSMELLRRVSQVAEILPNIPRHQIVQALAGGRSVEVVLDELLMAGTS